MAKNATDKIVEGLTMLLKGFGELEDMVEADYGTEPDDEEFSSHIVTEVSAAMETVVEDEEYTPEYIASVVSALMGALEVRSPPFCAMWCSRSGRATCAPRCSASRPPVTRRGFALKAGTSRDPRRGRGPAPPGH